MALPNSGVITWEMIRAEFGGPYPILINQYYRGGPLVPDVPANNRIPVGSGALSAWQFYGASKASPLSMTLSHTEIYGYSPSAGTIYTPNVTATPSGGTGSYTYSWTRISGQTSVFVSAGTSSVTFYSTFYRPGTTRYATFRCTISDGVSSVYRDVYVEITCGQLS